MFKLKYCGVLYIVVYKIIHISHAGASPTYNNASMGLLYTPKKVKGYIGILFIPFFTFVHHILFPVKK